MPILLMLFAVVWFSFAVLIGGAVFVSALFGDMEGDRRVALVSVPLILGAGVLMFALDRFSARRDERYLLAFIRYMLDAT
ncbi:MAG TPA: hypothetical protein PLN53_05770 [Terricaulis sp.]|nr:hypothetical protein [Terricaulis sp.]